MKTWFEVISELFVNIAAAWFVAGFIDTQTAPASTLDKIFLLMFKALIGILSLFVAKYLRVEAERRKA